MDSPLASTNYKIRHSAAHVLAQAVLERFPNAKLGIGPPIDHGFYYDFDLDTPLTDDDLSDLEDRMKRIIQEKQTFSYSVKSRAAALDLVADQPYKQEIIQDLDLDDYSFYQNGPFLDLCKGPHVETTGDIKAFKLLRVSGAYWRGSETRPMLQRIYGTAFDSPKAMRVYLKQIAEAKKRDHRLLGKQLDLFSIQDSIGGGLVLWHPKGSVVRDCIESVWKKMHRDYEYQLVNSPHVGSSDLWKTSGHLDFYESAMFGPVESDHKTYRIKPMNCPFHSLIYKSKQWSYRDLPVRYAELGTVYRHERSGVLHGLLRVRGFTQDDAHIICRPDQVNTEIKNALTMSLALLKKFGFDSIMLYLSTQPPDKSIGDPEQWLLAETALKGAILSTGLDYEVDSGGGAFYGPKIDVKIKDALGRSWQCSTIQFDFNLPKKFDMVYSGSDAKKHQPIMIHRALLGSLERFFGILIEHYNGFFPFWLAPTQVAIVTVNPSVMTYAETCLATLKSHGIRVMPDFSRETMAYKIRAIAAQKIPYTVVIGDKEMETNTLAIRDGKTGKTDTMSYDDMIALFNKLNGDAYIW